MIRKISKLVLILFVLLCTTKFVFGQTTYEDLQGRFILELPKKWILEPQTNDKVYKFSEKSKSFIIEYNEDNNNVDELFLEGIELLKSAGLSNLETHTEVKEMKINGLPAKWGVFKSDYTFSGITLEIYGLVGSLGLENEGLYSIAMLNKKDFKKSESVVQKMFHSFRLPGSAVTGAQEIASSTVSTTNITETSNKDTSSKSGSATLWKHKEFSISLPPGWHEQETTRSMEKETIGWFKYDPIVGANSMLFCYKGIIWNRKLISQTAEKTVKGAIPDAKLIKSYVTKLANNKKANVMVYKGTNILEGQEVELGSVNIIYRGGKCVLHQLGMIPLKDINILEKELLAIANSVK